MARSRDVSRDFVRAWREQLIDLSRRNSLLNFRAPKSTSLTIAHPEAHSVVTMLLDGVSPQFASLQDDEMSQMALDSASEAAVATESISEAAQPRALLDRRLYVDSPTSEMNSRLNTIDRKIRQEYLDRGLWTLYLAVGELIWRDVDETESRAPLLMVPVELLYSKEGKLWKLRRTDDDVQANLAIQIKALDLGVKIPELPDDPDPTALSDWLAEISDAVAPMQGWVVEETVVLSRFSYFKEAMYRDLLENEAEIAEHPVLKAMADPEKHALSENQSFESWEIDSILPPEDSPLIRDADSSQRAAIAAAIKGSSLVIDGPPGTGKSQTIANLIGMFLHEQKTVLFVSEKAAALEVVRDRLTEAGLNAYVLELYSHQATRKEVAAALGLALDRVPQPPRGLSEAERSRALALRSRLSEIAERVNLPREPFGRSLNDVIGVIRRADTNLGTPKGKHRGNEVSEQSLSEVRNLASDAKRMWRIVERPEDFPWRGARVKSTNIPVLQGIRQDLEALAQEMGLYTEWFTAFPADNHEVKVHLDLIESAIRLRQHISPSWLTQVGADKLETVATHLASQIQDLESIRKKISALSRRPANDLLELDRFDAAQMTPRPQDWTLRTASDLATMLSRLRALETALVAASEDIAEVDDRLGLQMPETLPKLQARLDLVSCSLSSHRPRIEWLSSRRFNAAQAAFSALSSKCAEVEGLDLEVGQLWTREVIEHDVAQLHRRFVELHHGIRKLSSQYRQDKKRLKSLGQPGTSVRQLIFSLPQAIKWQRAAKDLQELEAEHSEVLGHFYSGTATRWEEVRQALDWARVIRGAFGSELSSAQTELLTASGDEELPEKAAETFERALSLVAEGVPYSESFSRVLPTLNIHDAIARIREYATWIHSAIEAIEAHGLGAKPGDQEPTLGGLVDLAQLLDEYRAILAEFGESSGERSAVLFTLYRGEETDVEELNQVAALVRALVDLADSDLSPGQIKAVFEVEDLGLESLRDKARGFDQSFSSLLNLFDPEWHAFVSSEVANSESALEYVDALLRDESGPREWHEFRQLRNRADSLGLADAYDFCISRVVPSTRLEDELIAAYLSGWVDGILEEEAEEIPSRFMQRDEIVEEFRKVDQRIVHTAVSRIIDSANTMRPRVHVGAAGLIRSEASKKSRHKPIRDLMAQASSVIQGVKPVFMMSPLSVSQFLPTTMSFDVVIFDEASQVRPADAINSIYRGKQVIVAGDQKQLPPTSYYDVSSTDDETEDEEIDAHDFESVLDIAKRAMPSRPLLWHYRSRHESLIAFSNHKFYAGHLYTFPSARDEAQDLGVELIKVDGVYRRGTSRDNLDEARKVAERVVFHFENRPNMSLGVVTFSDSQKIAVQREVERALAARPDLAMRANEDRLRGFFVKNLEAVQGDERDVMIFSIGYGYDTNGKMLNTFGPVTKDGGWRRLNVAITRALYRVEVVSSITGNDIVGTANPSVLHLRDYLLFAERGLDALQIDVDASGKSTESPFEESVKLAIEQMGFIAEPQVGTAGYRIDLGIRHPERPGVFILGVECDGYQYHSSRVARDRDRLRQTVLEGLGWNLHRIWGTSWYRNNDQERERLQTALTRALRTQDAWVGLIDPKPQVEVVLAPTQIPERPKWAKEYQVARGLRRPRAVDPGDISAMPKIREFIQEVVQQEGPVHVSTLRQRFRDVWGIQRFGANIEKQWAAALKSAKIERRPEDFFGVVGKQIEVRVPLGEEGRKASAIDLEELCLAVVYATRDAMLISRDELRSYLTSLFGWGRQTPEIQARLDAAIDGAITSGTIAENDMHLRSVS